MFDFGDELTLQSYKIPWLIWIQLLVLFLLIFLLYCFSLLASDRSDASPSTSRLVSNETQIEKPIPKHNTTTIVTNCLEITQVWISLPLFSKCLFNIFLFHVVPTILFVAHRFWLRKCWKIFIVLSLRFCLLMGDPFIDFSQSESSVMYHISVWLSLVGFSNFGRSNQFH